MHEQTVPVPDTSSLARDAHIVLDGDHEQGFQAEIQEIDIPNGTLDTAVIPSPMVDSPRNASLSTSVDRNLDAASVHSMPTVPITESTPPPHRPSTAHSSVTSRFTSRAPPSSPSRSQTLQDESTFTQQQRRARHRSAIDARSSNRLSGFFTNLMHRRDNAPTNTTRDTIQGERSTAISESDDPPSRPSTPPERPVTPPPALPPPTLHELGLSLSSLTQDLSPPQFSTPPSGGAFLAPCYLLLCHSQGLDVLPLASPPAPQPYALIRRVSFKSVVVMEQRGVLVAIAGRRDGVRVYALEEVKRAIEWRMEVEVKRERDRLRRETVKKVAMRSIDASEPRESSEKTRKTSLSTPPPGESMQRGNLLRKASYSPVPIPPSVPPIPLVPRAATHRIPARKPKMSNLQMPSQSSEPMDQPPPYVAPASDYRQTPQLHHRASAISFNPRSRGGSISNVLSTAVSRRSAEVGRAQDPDTKADWVESSDDEAINVVAAGSSGSQALDERTSATLSANRNVPGPSIQVPTVTSRSSLGSSRRNRPSNLDLSLTRSNTAVPPPEPSPAPTLLTLRQALSHSPPSARDTRQVVDSSHVPHTPFSDGEEEDDVVDGQISLAQALFESRLPDLPPIGTRRPQEPILLSSSVSHDDSSPTRTSDSHRSLSVNNTTSRTESGPRRRWSILINNTASDSLEPGVSTAPATAPLSRDGRPSRFTRSHSFRSTHSQTSNFGVPASSETHLTGNSQALYAIPNNIPMLVPPPRTSRFFIPRIISNAFNGRRLDERLPLPAHLSVDADSGRRYGNSQIAPQTPPPKLEHVKLPGTKGALLIKAVETPKKSFLAILCGDSGERVELFAGTYRTALGLSRTFILPDSPRSLELQLQGDDLVEVFLVFSQNVFGLEPATVRVREVRIGRAERRAARRRAREARTGEPNDGDNLDEDTNVNVSIGVSVTVDANVVATGDGTDQPSSALVANEHPGETDRPSTPVDPTPTTTTAHSEEIVALATAQMGPYTTFQQLSFAPNFPLASIADEYIIPPTYPEFLDHKIAHEPQINGSGTDLSRIQFSPPGLPVPTPTAPSRWFYRDPKDVIHGPWKASLMQAWYKDGLLPPDLPLRREEETEYTLLKDLRLQSVDPNQPFRSPPVAASSVPAETLQNSIKLLRPISLLAQPRHFGPPALFFSSRGGHSTAIVDARGRSVLKGRFLWSNDDPSTDAKPHSFGKMGDVKRIEAFDVKDRSILVAMRQGGLEAVDLGDALLKPGDDSRTALPQFHPPVNNVNRRAPFVWKIGTPIGSPHISSLASTSKEQNGNLPLKKLSMGPTKSTSGRQDGPGGDIDDNNDEVLFLGRRDDQIFFCERNATSFRILRLCPN